MPSPLSLDLRERACANVSWPPWRKGPRAIELRPASGSACRAPAAGQSAFTRRGRSRPDLRAGDHASHRIEAHAELILSTCEREPRIFLRELRDRLAEHGVQTSTSGLSRFFQRHRVTWKKGRSARRSRSART